MKRLIEKGLMFGNLVFVESPALVERYNRADLAPPLPLVGRGWGWGATP